ncbi:methylated-DNA--cysteine S-met [Mycena amicta]|nr:methylated-DNA--cysteine S-met [Mycena amicta]
MQPREPSLKKYTFLPRLRCENSTARTRERQVTLRQQKSLLNLKKRVTPHQWDVYDYTRTIPAGKVVTYKDVCDAVGGSPRSVGGALRTNPFAPFVPCHRVIASNLFIGGFLGEWGRQHKTGTQCDRKLALLAQEGVSFTKDGYLKGKEMLWQP